MMNTKKENSTTASASQNCADSITLEWVTTTLVNDEASDDQDLREHFESGGDMPYAEACFYVSQRNEALRDPLNFRLRPYLAAYEEAK